MEAINISELIKTKYLGFPNNNVSIWKIFIRFKYIMISLKETIQKSLALVHKVMAMLKTVNHHRYQVDNYTRVYWKLYFN